MTLLQVFCRGNEDDASSLDSNIPAVSLCILKGKGVPDENLLALAAKITTSFLSGNEIKSAQLPLVIRSIYQTLSGINVPDETPSRFSALQEPAVDPRESVFPDYIVCLEDGRKLKVLKRYLLAQFDMTPDQYREKWGLPPNYPMAAPNYSKKRSAMAKSSGLGQTRSR